MVDPQFCGRAWCPGAPDGLMQTFVSCGNPAISRRLDGPSGPSVATTRTPPPRSPRLEAYRRDAFILHDLN
jgi:hypothetical protein